MGWRAAIVLALAAFAPACATTMDMSLTPAGSRVRVSDASSVTTCEYLGDFVGGTISGTPPYNRSAPAIYGTNQVRNLAAEKGATDVVVEVQHPGDTLGHGYRCRP